MVGDQQSSAAQAERIRRGPCLATNFPFPVRSQTGGSVVTVEGKALLVDERSHDGVPISRKCCRTVSRTFAEHFGQ